ncbi:MAG: NmrA family NAD(P)-binding protein [Natronospirillum sp.]|uniref:NmrA family NAD(P)-binding protein n=1 Tax=Natronospirillum sp. TaxID=2812955 RepID=UPI0025F7F1D5|nr:NmrA family NAD(P)-binding protein [Natronospirillum sp.]MCH8552273.1 NmrA family NAD(P)-binding protein [Natronospirillum sp.]
MKVLVTGATGNVGSAVLSSLQQRPEILPVAGVRQSEIGGASGGALSGVACRTFDFEDPTTFDQALEGIDLVFLLRPPQISDIKRYFQPLIRRIKQLGIQQVVLLSVQNAEKSNVIPHRKIEKLILEHGLDHIFLRPAYFMENLTTTLLPEIHSKRSITLPSGKAEFNWVTVQDIGALAAEMISDFPRFRNQAYTVSGAENLSFSQVVERINRIAGTDITYRSVNPLRYYRIKRQEGEPKGKVLVMLILHFLPVLQGPPEVSKTYKEVMNTEPTSLEAFIEQHKAQFV